MQQVAEFVENGLHFAVSQQGRPAAGGRRQIAADQAQVRAEAAGGRTAGDQRVHPGAAALVFARIPVGVKAAQERPGFVVDVVVARLRIPNRNAGLFRHA